MVIRTKDKKLNAVQKTYHNKTEGRLAKKRRRTRALLLKVAYDEMTLCGIDNIKIKDITDKADIGFGTFYNYFDNKDELANQVLDCIINDFGRRNLLATKSLSKKDAPLRMPISIRLVLRAAMEAPMWKWWALRPDMLVERMTKGFGPFGMRDIRQAVTRGIFTIEEQDIPAIWKLSVWVMVAGLHNAITSENSAKNETLVVETIMRMMGMSPQEASQASNTDLPDYPSSIIDWNFSLDQNG